MHQNQYTPISASSKKGLSNCQNISTSINHHAELIAAGVIDRFIAEHPESFSPNGYNCKSDKPRLLPKRPASSVLAVGFDLYDTLITTTAQEPGVLCSDQAQETDQAAVCRSIEFLNLFVLQDPKSILAQFEAGARQQKEPIKLPSGVTIFPEMDAPALWATILKVDGETAIEFATAFELFRAQYEVMAGVPELLTELKDAGTPCGIISNSQVYTLPIARKVFERAGLADFDSFFPQDLRLMSHQSMIGMHSVMKPTLALFDELVSRFNTHSTRQCHANEVLFVGNCERNDGASRDAGLQFALCAVVPGKTRLLNDGVARDTLRVDDYAELPQRFSFSAAR